MNKKGKSTFDSDTIFVIIVFICGIIGASGLVHLGNYIDKHNSHPLFCGNRFCDICLYLTILGIGLFIILGIIAYFKTHNLFDDLKWHFTEYYKGYLVGFFIILILIPVIYIQNIIDKEERENFGTRRSLFDNLKEEQRYNKELKEYLFDCDEEYGEYHPEYPNFDGKSNTEIQNEIERLKEENFELSDRVDYFESIGCL